MTIWDCPITTPYGQVPGYPLNNGFHNGIDYGAPTGTDVTVNGVIIAKSGNTGYSTGPHCHVGHWRGGTVLDPGKLGGKTVSGAVVSQVAEDSINGKYVRVADADGSSWVYLHLSQQLVTVGQKLEGGLMETLINEGDLPFIKTGIFGLPVNPGDKDFLVGKTWKQGITDLANGNEVKNTGFGARVALLENERDKELYPRITATTDGLALPSGATAADIAKAIEKLKSATITKSQVVDYIVKNLP